MARPGPAPFEHTAQPPPAADQVVCAEMAAGSALVYSGGVLHGGGTNTTNVPRRGTHLSDCLGWLRTDENNVLAVPPAAAATLPGQTQELLGTRGTTTCPRGGA